MRLILNTYSMFVSLLFLYCPLRHTIKTQVSRFNKYDRR